MSMSSAQMAAFEAAGGFAPSASHLLFVGFVLTLASLWGAWAIYSTYKGWATSQLTSGLAASTVLRIMLLCMVLAFLLLS